MLRNIGIFAHVDAGKTTLSEQLLLLSGTIRETGSVDRGTAHTDSLPVERRRGISVRSACVRLSWKGTEINWIDTPGHTDFTAEIERSLWALDGAVLLVSAPEGVEPQTELLFHSLQEARIPTLIFLNKCDRPEANPEAAMAQIRRRLSSSVVSLFDRENLVETVCGEDEILMERYLNGEVVSESDALKTLRKMVQEARGFPVWKGSALRGDGVEALLDGIRDFLPGPDTGESSLCGIVFAAEQDRLLGRGVWVRLFGGTLQTRDSVRLPGKPDPMTGETLPVEKKITQIRSVAGNDTGMLKAGEIGIVYGLEKSLPVRFWVINKSFPGLHSLGICACR